MTSKESETDSKLGLMLEQAKALWQFRQLGQTRNPDKLHLAIRLGKDNGKDWNDFLTGQLATIGKRFRAMPISGRWPIRNNFGSLLLGRQAHQEDGDIWTDRNPIANYVNTLTLTPKEGLLTLKIEQIEALDGQTKLSSIKITSAQQTVTFTPV